MSTAGGGRRPDHDVVEQVQTAAEQLHRAHHPLDESGGMSGILHLLAMLATLGTIAVVPWPELCAPLARAVALSGLGVLAVTMLAALIVWRRHRPATSREWAEAIADRAIKVALAVVSQFAGGGSAPSDEQVEATEQRTGVGLVMAKIAAKVFDLFGRTAFAVAFFLGWTLVHMLVWSFDSTPCPTTPDGSCSSAYQGMGESPTVGDFLYLAVNAAFVNFPPDFVASSRVAHTVVVLELISGFALVTAFAARFLGMRSPR